MEDYDLEGPEAALYATIIPVGGNRIVIPLDANSPVSIVDGATASGLTVPANSQFWVDGVQVPGDTPLANGMQVTVVGNIKGG